MNVGNVEEMLVDGVINMTYMIFNITSGNAVDSFENFNSAAESLKKICELEPECKEELSIIEFDSKGHAINACKYEDLYN